MTQRGLNWCESTAATKGAPLRRYPSSGATLADASIHAHSCQAVPLSKATWSFPSLLVATMLPFAPYDPALSRRSRSDTVNAYVILADEQITDVFAQPDIFALSPRRRLLFGPSELTPRVAPARRPFIPLSDLAIEQD